MTPKSLCRPIRATFSRTSVGRSRAARPLDRAQAGETMAKVVSERIVARLKNAGYVILRKPPPSAEVIR
jgi:hypothetical protein